jgi:hypothetical protein
VDRAGPSELGVGSLARPVGPAQGQLRGAAGGARGRIRSGGRSDDARRSRPRPSQEVPTMTQFNTPDLVGDSPAWLSFIWIAFLVSISLMLLGIFFIPVDWWVKGYLYMGTLFLTASTLTLSKSLRDKHEYERLVNRVKSARTEQVLSKFES